MTPQSTIQAALATTLRGTATFLDASVLINDFEYPITNGVHKAPYAIFGTGGFSTTDGCIITWTIPLTLLTQYGVLPYVTAMNAAQVVEQAVIDALASSSLIIEMSGEEPIELDDKQLGHEFIIQQMTLIAGNRK